jgi:recombinational DNA repair protein (RecF pathway)
VNAHGIQRLTAARYYAELADRAREEAQRNARVVKLLQDCHARIIYAHACENVVWGDRDLLQRISEEIMEAKR